MKWTQGSAVFIADLCTVDSQGLRDHQTNAAATASDKCDASLQVEQVIAIEFAMAGCCDTLCCHCGCLCCVYQGDGSKETRQWWKMGSVVV